MHAHRSINPLRGPLYLRKSHCSLIYPPSGAKAEAKTEGLRIQ